MYDNNDDLLWDLFLNWLLCLKMLSIRFGGWREVFLLSRRPISGIILLKRRPILGIIVLRLERFDTISNSKTSLDCRPILVYV